MMFDLRLVLSFRTMGVFFLTISISCTRVYSLFGHMTPLNSLENIFEAKECVLLPFHPPFAARLVLTYICVCSLTYVQLCLQPP